LELWLNILRTRALPALIIVVAKISHMVSLPTQVLSWSINRDTDRKGAIVSPLLFEPAESKRDWPKN
jgi:hypothetical protein